MSLILNLACGATRPQGEEWINLDTLRSALRPGTPERTNLDQEERYVEHNLLHDGMLPFPNEHFDVVVASHCLEHWDCQEGIAIMKDCYRVLKNEGQLIVSVPDAAYFRAVNDQDIPDLSIHLFGEPIYAPDGEDTFFGYALWNRYHKAIMSEDTLWAYFRRAGFHNRNISKRKYPWPYGSEAFRKAMTVLNRLMFSVILIGTKGDGEDIQLN